MYIPVRFTSTEDIQFLQLQDQLHWDYAEPMLTTLPPTPSSPSYIVTSLVNVLFTESLDSSIEIGEDHPSRDLAKLFDREVAMRRTRTLCPGAQDFMSPESCGDSPKYDDKLDVFSFGHLAIYLVNQRLLMCSIKLWQEETLPDSRCRLASVVQHWPDQMGGPRHPLYTTVVQCLSDTPDQRPTSRDLVKRMEQTCQQFSIPHKNTLELEKLYAQLKWI